MVSLKTDIQKTNVNQNTSVRV